VSVGNKRKRFLVCVSSAPCERNLLVHIAITPLGVGKGEQHGCGKGQIKEHHTMKFKSIIVASLVDGLKLDKKAISNAVSAWQGDRKLVSEEIASSFRDRAKNGHVEQAELTARKYQLERNVVAKFVVFDEQVSSLEKRAKKLGVTLQAMATIPADEVGDWLSKFLPMPVAPVAVAAVAVAPAVATAKAKAKGKTVIQAPAMAA